MNNNTAPLVSLIVPVYNVENFLPYLFDDIKNQTFKNFEVIFVNDCSTDNSLSLINNFKEEMKDSTISVVIINHKVNSGGCGYPRNTGLDAAKGKYVCFIDSDDSIKPEYLETLLYSIQKNNSDLGVVSFNYQKKKVFQNDVNEKKVKLTPYYYSDQIDSYGDLAFFIGLKLSVLKNIAPAVVWNKIFKKELLADDVRFASLGAEDVKFESEYIVKCKKVGFINKNLYNYFVDNKGSISAISDNPKYLKFCKEVLTIIPNILKNYTIATQDYEKTAAYLFTSYIMVFYNIKRFKWHKKHPEVYKEMKKFLDYTYVYFKKCKSISTKWWFLGVLYRIIR